MCWQWQRYDLAESLLPSRVIISLRGKTGSGSSVPVSPDRRIVMMKYAPHVRLHYFLPLRFKVVSVCIFELNLEFSTRRQLQ